MPHWLQATIAVAGALASWRFVVRPFRRGIREVLTLLRQIRDASTGVQTLARELHTLAGSFVMFAHANTEQLRQLSRELAEQAARQADLAQLYVDLTADVTRLTRAHRKGA